MRNINTDPKQEQAVGAFLNRFGTTVSVDQLCNEGVVLSDLSGRKVAPAYGVIREQMIHTGQPYAEIMVIVLDGGVIAGWVRAESLMFAEDRYIVPVKALNPVPDTFDFAQPCPHMSVYGGIYTDDMPGWQCLGCGQTIIVR